MLTCVDAMLHNLPAKFTKIADSADVDDRAGILSVRYHIEGRGGYNALGTQ